MLALRRRFLRSKNIHTGVKGKVLAAPASTLSWAPVQSTVLRRPAVFPGVTCTSTMAVDATNPHAQEPVTNCDPPREKLPLERPLHFGGEEDFRNCVKSASLPPQLKEALCRDGVYCGRPEYVIGLLQKMVANGIGRFQVVSDFDQTLTRCHRDGKFTGSCYGILSHSSRLSQEFRDYTIALHDHYVHIELDPTMSVADKIPHMKEWWTKTHEKFVETKLRKEWLTEMVHQSPVEFRDRTDEFFTKLDQYGVPLLIYSAGVDNLITEVLNERSVIKKTALKPLIVANSMRFDDQDVICGFSEELIHTFNKNEIFPHHRDYFTKHEARRNVLLMGDMLGDLQMADGMRAKEIVITIGFLNAKIRESFALYRDRFDLVLVDDQTLDIPAGLRNPVDVAGRNGVLKFEWKLNQVGRDEARPVWQICEFRRKKCKELFGSSFFITDKFFWFNLR